jgi:hypothetical protein
MDPRSFREAIRTATVTYPVPYVVSVLLLFSLLCFGGSLTVTDALRWLLAGVGVVAALGAMAAFAYSLVLKPELLRSERHSLLTRFFDVLGDSDMDAVARERVGHAILDAAEPRVPKRLARDDGAGGPASGKESSDG